MTRECLQCGKVFEVNKKNSKKRQNVNRWCSRKCFKDSGVGKKTQFKKGHEPLVSQDGENSHSWKGESVGYSGLHHWVRKELGSANMCEFCGTKQSKRYEWASIKHKYIRDKKEWISLCKKCHCYYDRNGFNDLRL